MLYQLRQNQNMINTAPKSVSFKLATISGYEWDIRFKQKS